MSLSNLGLDAFYCVSKYKTVLEASRHLGITQTAVTQRLKALEEDIGSTLFIRSRKGMELTDAGIKLAQFCQQREMLEGEVLSQIKDEGTDIPVRIKVSGSTYFIASRVLDQIGDYSKRFQNVFFSFNVCDDDDKILQLKKGMADFIFVSRETVPLELDSKLLKKSRYILVGGEKYKKSKKDFTLIDFSPLDTFTSEFFVRSGIEFNKGMDRHYINNTMFMPQMLERNMGVAVLDLEHFKKIKDSHKVYNIFPSIYYEIEWALAWYPRTEKPTYFKAFIDLIK